MSHVHISTVWYIDTFQVPDAEMPYIPAYEETSFLNSLQITIDVIEFLTDSCTKVRLLNTTHTTCSHQHVLPTTCTSKTGLNSCMWRCDNTILPTILSLLSQHLTHYYPILRDWGLVMTCLSWVPLLFLFPFLLTTLSLLPAISTVYNYTQEWV